MVKFERNLPVTKVKKHIPLSATLIASVLLALNPKEHVIAQEAEEKNIEIEVDNVYAKYHSLLDEMEQEDTKEGSADLDFELDRELSAEEVKAIQEQLILFIEKEGGSVVTEVMKEEVSTLAELEELFADLLKEPVLEDESEQAEQLIEEESVEVDEIVIDEEPADLELHQANVAQLAMNSAIEAADKSVSYTVRAGDTLNKIAKAYNVTVNHIAELNNIQNINAIRVGQVLAIQGTKIENQIAGDLADLDKPMTNNEFVDYLGNHASVAAKEQNLYASVMIAQAALESGFGTSGLSSAPNHNLYGMKGRYEGESVLMRTREYSKEKGWYSVDAHFKKYPSYLESLLDHSAYIRRGPSWAPDYYKNVWRENTTSYRDATSWLQGRYATDPTYANKLNNIIESYNLTRFDGLREDDVVVQPPADHSRPEQDVKPSTGDKEANHTPEHAETSTYRVKSGDTLSRIALAHKMSLQELKELNSLHSDLILVGQSLKVKESVVEVKPTPAPSKPTESNTAGYTVKRGDTLSRIAPLYKMSVRELKDLNKLKSDLIYVGQVLKVKSSVIESVPTPTPTPPKPTAPVKPTRPSSSSYTIKRGDTLSEIARVHKTSVHELKELNNLKSDLIFVGQQLKINQASKGNSSAGSQSYQIKAGDTLSAIARRFNTTVKKLKETNQLKSDLIYVNQRLTV